MKTIKLALKKLTNVELLNDNNREYNPGEWAKMVNRYSNYGAEFYKVDKDDTYDYDRFYAVYSLPEGLRLFSPIGYGSMVHNGGFKTVNLFLEDGEIVVFGFGDNGCGSAANTPKNRAILSKSSVERGAIYTSAF